MYNNWNCLREGDKEMNKGRKALRELREGGNLKVVRDSVVYWRVKW
jgi:hypothetical protein